jgi:hypothetical protein
VQFGGERVDLAGQLRVGFELKLPFLEGLLFARWLTGTGRVQPQDYDAIVGASA